MQLVKWKQMVKWAFFPGLDLHTRCRYRFLPNFFRSGDIETLDAGCGNGALAYAAYRKGNRVLGISLDSMQVERAKSFFSRLGIPEQRLKYQVLNLYELPTLDQQFDQIICTETLEHIKQDRLIIQFFARLLRRGGLLHLCCPYALHPANQLGRVNEPEDGGHVRDGYTEESFQGLLKSEGFVIQEFHGLGSRFLQGLDRPLRRLRSLFGDGLALPFFLIILPFSWFERLDPNPPLSLYVRAVRK